MADIESDMRDFLIAATKRKSNVGTIGHIMKPAISEMAKAVHQINEARANVERYNSAIVQLNAMHAKCDPGYRSPRWLKRWQNRFSKQ